MSILEEIFQYKHSEVARRRKRKSFATVRREAESAGAAIDFVVSLRQPPTPSLIAEIKRASPSRGIIRACIQPDVLAQAYIDNGARAVSILTDERYFHGNFDDLDKVRQKFPHIPILQKDFIFDNYQIYEARAAGADAILLITAGLDIHLMDDLAVLSHELGMIALIEVHTMPELEKALKLSPRMVGVNNRNLHTFEVSLGTTKMIAPHIPPGVVIVSESGIHSRKDVDELKRAGVHALLIGEALITSPDPGGKVRELAGLFTTSEAITNKWKPAQNG